MDSIISISTIAGLLIVVGTLLGLADRRHFAPGWLLFAAALVVLNDALLTNFHGALPDMLPGASWNWQGKALALMGTLGIAALPWFGWQRAGLTLRHAPGSLRACLPVAMAYVLFFVALALVLPDEDAGAETLAFQLTMPSLEEEAFYRGLLLLALGEAFRGRWRWLGVEWHWGVLLSCLVFGLAHAFGHGDTGFSFDAITMALTAVPSLLGAWLRLRTGSLLLPVLLHSAGNSLSLLI
jgi:uncharacterized protein